MPSYSINKDLKGPKFVLQSRLASPQGSSGIIPLIPVALHTASLQQTFHQPTTNAADNALQLKFDAESTVALNEWAGQYAYVSSGSLDEAQQIVSNTAASSGSEITLTFSTAFSQTVGADGAVTIRKWSQLKKPVLVSSINQFAETYLSRSSDGAYDWNNSENAYHSIQTAKDNGASLIYVVPVENPATAEGLVTNLGSGLTDDSTFQQWMLDLSPQPDCVVIAAQDFEKFTFSDDNLSTVLGQWKDYVTSRATDSTFDDKLRELILVADCGVSANASTAQTFRDTKTNYSGLNAERIVFVYNRLVVPSLTVGDRSLVSAAPAYAGIMNRISTQAPESFGHAFAGRNWTQVSALDVQDSPSPSDRLALASRGINPVIKADGLYFEYQLTQKKTSSDAGNDPLTALHVVVTRQKIKNTIQPLLARLTDEQNTQIVRNRALSLVRGYLDSLVRQSVISSYEFVDVTTASDENAGVARYELSAYSPNSIKFIETTFTSVFGS